MKTQNKPMFLLVLSIFLTSSIFGQETISGKISTQTNAPLSKAVVTVLGTNTGILTEPDGIFNLILPQGNYTIRITKDGCRSIDTTLAIRKVNAPVNIKLNCGYDSVTDYNKPGYSGPLPIVLLLPPLGPHCMSEGFKKQ